VTLARSYGTSGGVEITDAVIERLADDAQKGYPPHKLRARGRPPMGETPARVTQVRLPPELAEALYQRAEAEHARPSEVIREALRAYLKPS
jgi:CRISPR-associated endonuclease/helicase Cas3